MRSLFSWLAVISRKTSSSAPISSYRAASSTGSPASRRFTKLTPFTTRPSFTSRHGMILRASMSGVGCWVLGVGCWAQYLRPNTQHRLSETIWADFAVKNKGRRKGIMRPRRSLGVVLYHSVRRPLFFVAAEPLLSGVTDACSLDRPGHSHLRDRTFPTRQQAQGPN